MVTFPASDLSKAVFDSPHTLPRRSPTVRLNGCTAAPIVARAAEGVFVLTRGHNSRMKAFYCALFFFCLTLVLAHPPSPNAKDEDSGENQHRNSTGGVSGPAASPSPVGVPDRSSPATPGRTGAAARGPGRSTRESNVGAAASQVCAAIRGLLRIAGATRTVGLTAVACRRSADLPRSWQAFRAQATDRCCALSAATSWSIGQCKTERNSSAARASPSAADRN